MTAGGKRLTEAKIQTGILQGNAQSSLRFVIVMIQLNHILRRCTAGYKHSKSEEKFNPLMYIDDIKLFAENKKELETQTQAERKYSQDIGMDFGIEKCAMLIIKSRKRHMIEGMELPNQKKS